MAASTKDQRASVREAMRDGRISISEGLAEIQRLMREELLAHGVSKGGTA